MMSEKEVDDLVTMWHESDKNDKTPLHEFLGWTVSQYKAWVETGVIPVTPGAD